MNPIAPFGVVGFFVFAGNGTDHGAAVTVDGDFTSLQRILRHERLSVQTASSGLEALEYLERQSFCLLMTGYHMPGMDGMELARKATALAPDMAIIMSAGSISPSIPRQAKAAGVARVLPKTTPPKEILAAVREVIGGWTGTDRVDRRR